MFTTMLIVVLVLLLIGVLPHWNYSADWGYRPSWIAGVTLVVVLILALAGYV